MKIVADKRIPGLADALSDMEGLTLATKEGSDITAADVRDADVLFVRTRTQCDASLLSGSRVRMVGTATIGTDHIDLSWCADAGIRVVSAPGCNAPAVMQYVASSLHAAGFDPSRHVLGVVGKGNIGSLVVDLYRDAGATVLVSDPPRADAGLTDEEYLSLPMLLERCDAVTFHVPYTKSEPYPTHRLLHGQLPSNLKFIVNSSRGGVVAPEIIDGSRKFIIDTWPFEEDADKWTPQQREALVGKAFIATPHIAGYSIEGKARATAAMLTALDDFRAGVETQPVSTTRGLRYSLPEVTASFNPMPLSAALKAAPGDFESLRSSHLRPEPKAKQFTIHNSQCTIV